MHHTVSGLAQPTNGFAALAVLVGCIGILVAVFLGLVENKRRRWQLGAEVVTGLILRGVRARFSAALGLYAAIALLVLLGGTIILSATKEGSISSPKLPPRLRRSIRFKHAVLVVVALFTICAALAIGSLIGGVSDETSPTVVVRPGRFHVSGTCANGACTVNVCVTPAPCGLENEGRLQDGAAIEIECQTPGALAHAPNGVKSTIWDRLAESGYFISDLFVAETRTGRFTEGIPRCAKA